MDPERSDGYNFYVYVKNGGPALRITWDGDATFSVASADGTKVILAPCNYPECDGYLAITAP